MRIFQVYNVLSKLCLQSRHPQALIELLKRPNIDESLQHTLIYTRSVA